MPNAQPPPPEVPELPRAAPGAPPLWPVPRAGDQRLRPQVSWAIGCLGAAALGGCVLLLFGMGLLLGRAGVFRLGRSPAHSASGISVTNPTPSPTPTTVVDWLQVDPTSVQVGCGQGQQTQVVVLANRGPQPVQWQASLSVPADQAGVAVAPHEGGRAGGARIAAQLPSPCPGAAPQE